MQSLHSVHQALCVKAALNPKCPSKVKSRILTLYENGVITAGDVERLFSKFELKGA